MAIPFEVTGAVILMTGAWRWWLVTRPLSQSVRLTQATVSVPARLPDRPYTGSRPLSPAALLPIPEVVEIWEHGDTVPAAMYLDEDQ